MSSTSAVLPALLALAEGARFNPLNLDQSSGFLWTLIIFAVSAPFIWIVVMGPVTRALEERDSKAVRAIEQAQQASSDAERARAAVEVSLGEARAEAARLLAATRERAQVLERELVEEAKGQALALLEGARRTIQAEQDKAIAAIREEVVDLALSGARRVLGRHVGGDDDRRLVSELVAGVQAGQGERA